MSDSLLSPHWYRVAKLQPKLHSHIEIHRHDYRGLIWYILEDTTTGRNHRFNPAAYQFIGLMDGSRSIQNIYSQISEQLEDYAPGQEEIIQLLGQLNAADLIQTNSIIDTEELFERQVKKQRSKLQQRFTNPVAQKIPLWDPEEFLNRNFNKVSWIFNRWVALLWVILISYTAISAASHWPQINRHFIVNGLAPYNLLIVFLLYPPIKLLHELGHAFSAKLEGGEVHEMGVNFLMFMPIPYVNVSTAAHFRDKYKRMLVSAAGILVESFLAALGILLFLATEPGIIQDIGFNIFVIGGVSSLFFNGNPLLKYDGYYVLADALGIPNLFQRSSQYWRYLFQRYLFGLRHVSSPANAPGETFWFILYSISSLICRLSILWFICTYVTEKFFFLGILLAIWLFSLQVLFPIYKAIKFVISSPSLRNKRRSAILSSSALICLFIVIFGIIPIPSYTMAEGVIWLPEEAQLKAKLDGFAGNLQAINNQIVNIGTPIIHIDDSFLKSRVKIARAKVQELQSQYRGKRQTEFVEAEIFKDKIRIAESELQHILNKTNNMMVTAFKSGKLLIPGASDLPGRYVRHGELLGYIFDEKAPTVRTVIKQDNIGQLRKGVVDIKIRFANNLDNEYSAKIIRQSPEATHRLPTKALGTDGGGKIAVDPSSQDKLLSLERIFLIDLNFESLTYDIPIGTRAYVRINHGGESIAKQWFRRIQQIFLRQFNV